MKLTDADLTRLAAEKVMGWEIVKRISGGIMYGRPDKCQLSPYEWDPLTDWRAAGEIVEKMRADGWDYRLTEIECWFHRGPTFSEFCRNEEKIRAGSHESTQAPRAITIAALLAVAAITEEQL